MDVVDISGDVDLEYHMTGGLRLITRIGFQINGRRLDLQDPVVEVPDEARQRLRVGSRQPFFGRQAVRLFDEAEERGQRFRDVEVVLEPGDELRAGRLDRTRHFGADRAPALHAPEVDEEVADPVAARPRLVEGLEGEIEHLPVMRGEEEEPDLARVVPPGQDVAEDVEVPLGLGHLLAVDDEVVAVEPVVHELDAVRRLGLGDLVLVVGEDVVDAAAVDVEGRAQVFLAHGRALDVPARSAPPDLRVPERLALLGRLPEGEVVDALLVVLVGVAAAARPAVLEVDLGQPAVGRELVDGEIDGAVLLVGEALLEEGPDEGDHLRDVLRGPGVMVGGQDVQEVALGHEGGDIFFGVALELLHRAGPGVADRLVVDVGEVHDVGDPEAAEQSGTA